MSNPLNRSARTRRPSIDLENAQPYLLLALVTYLPLLVSRPGKIAGDTSDAVLSDPFGALTSAATRWNPGVGFGVLRDSTYSASFPMSPFFAGAHALGLPAWVAQRLWLGSILFAAGAGVLQLLRTMRWEGRGQMVAALAYVMTPYAVLNLGTRSVALLAWAGLPWLVAATMAALENRPGGDWRYPARFAVVVALVGGANLSALAYVAVGPLLWVLYSVAATRDVAWRRALAVSARIVGASAAVLTWRLVGVVLRPVAELDAVRDQDPAGLVALATNPTRVLRGLGDWAIYATNGATAGSGYLRVIPLVFLTLLGPAFGLLSLGRQRFHNRVYFVLLVVAGTVLTVGMSPPDAPEAYGRLLRPIVQTRVGALLLPTARATPLVLLGLAVGIASGVRTLIAAVPDRTRSIELLAAIPALLCVPALPLGSALDGPTLRGNIPQYWHDAADAINAPEHDGYAVLELPGLERPDYVWGTTREPVSFTLIDRTVALRTPDRSPQAATADLLAAIDETVLAGRLSPNAIAPLARLMGVDSILLRGDTPGIDGSVNAVRSLHTLLAGAPGFGPPDAYGGIVDGLPALSVFPVLDPQPEVRLTDQNRTVIVAGTGAGLVSLANQGVLSGDEAVVYSASLALDDFAALPIDVPVIITDSSRWTDVRDVGLDDSASAANRRFSSARIIRSDQPAPLGTAIADAYAVTRFQGGDDVSATSYGAPDAILPEYRPGNAFDGDPDTAWEAGIGADPVGERLNVSLGRQSTAVQITVRQPTDGADPITRVRLSVTTGKAPDEQVAEQDVDLTEASLTAAGQTIELDEPLRGFQNLTLEILEVQHRGDQSPGAGFADVKIPGVTVSELVVVPSDLDRFEGVADHPLALIFERWRTTPGQRTAPERRISRRFTLSSAREFTVEAEVSLENPDDAPNLECMADDEHPMLSIDGKPVRLTTPAGAGADRGAYQFSAPIDQQLGEGLHTVVTALPEQCGAFIDRLVFSDRVGAIAGPEPPGPRATVESSSDTSRLLSVGRLTGPMWLTLGVSYDPDWEGSTNGAAVAPATLLNGFASAWLLHRDTQEAFMFSARWSPQRVVNVGVVVSLAALVVAIALALIPTRRRSLSAAPAVDQPRVANSNLIVLAVLATFGIAAGPIPALAAGAAALALEQRPHLRRALSWVAPILLAVVAVATSVRIATSDPLTSIFDAADPAWVDVVTWTALAVGVTTALANTERPPVRRYTA